MGVVYNQREVNYETYGFPGLVYDFARAGNLRDGISKRNDYISIGRTTTGTYVGSDGLIKTAAAFEPRFEYDSSGNPLGLLIEEGRTNLITYSEQFDNTGWIKNTGQITFSANVEGAPDGTSTADRVNNIPNLSSWCRPAVSISNSTTYTFSLYVKPLTTNKTLVFEHTGSTNRTSFNLDTLTTSGPGTCQIIPISNGWYRIVWTFTGISGLGGFPQFPTLFIGGYPTTSDSASFLFWGTQVETGTFPTSYIPTSGSAVTRGTDNFTISSPNFYNSSNSSIILHYVPKSTTGTQPLLSFDDNTTNNEVKVSIATTTPTLNVVNAGVTTVAIGTAPNVSTTNLEYRVSLSAKDNQFTLASEGIGVVTTTSGSLPVGITTMRIGHDRSGNRFSGHIKKLIYYPRELTTPALRVFSTVQDGYSQIVNDGLVLHLDAGNRKSYSGSGTIWTDLSGRGNTGTLVNGVGYNSDNSGSLVFDGSNDYINSIQSSSVQLTDSMTISCWFRPNNFAGGRQGLVGRNGLNEYNITLEPGGEVSFYFASIGQPGNYFNGASFLPFGQTNGVHQNLSIVRDYGTNVVYIYKNGSLVSTGSQSLAGTSKPTATSGPMTIGFGNGGYFNGRVSNVMLYNRALTASEIQQNFNALRGRFGI